MNIYKVTQESEISNKIVKELNAKVLTLTFNITTGVRSADLYYSKNSGYYLVGSGTPGPINTVFVSKTLIQF